MRLFNRPFLPLLLALTLGIWTGGLPVVIKTLPIGFIIAAAAGCFILTIAELLYRKQTLVFPLLLFCFLGWLSIAPCLNPRVTTDHILNFVDNRKHTVSGLVVTNPELKLDRQSFELALTEIVDADGNLQPLKGKIRVNYAENAIMVPYGAKVTVKGYLREIHSFMNPAGFDYERFMALKQTYGSMYVNVGDLHIYDPQAHGAYALKTLYRFKNHANALIVENVAGNARGVLQALLTGNRTNITPDVNDAFSKTGLAHVLSISGLHVGIVSLFFCTVFLLLLKFVPMLKQDSLKRSAALLLSIAPILIYCIFSGFEAPAQRAFIVFTFFIAGFASLRVQDSFNSTLTAAFLILLLFPAALFSVSFQLSFAAIFGLTFGNRFLNALGLLNNSTAFLKLPGLRIRHPRVYRKLNDVCYWAVSCCMMSLFAIIATAPIVTHYFFNAGYSGLLLNLLMIPILTFIVLPCGILALLFSWCPAIAGLLLKISAFCLNFTIEATLNAAALPHTSAKWVAPSLWEVLCFYGLLFGLLYWLAPPRWQRGTEGFFKARLQTPVCRVGAVVIIISLSGLAGSTVYWLKDRYYRSDVKVTFIDIGQGNATFMEFPGGYNVLIDGGGFRSTGDFDVGKNVLEPFLRHRKVAAIDTIILTHGDYDHVGGLFYIVENFKVRQVWLPDFESKESLAFMETMRRAGVAYDFIAQEKQLQLAPGYVAEFYNPPADITKDYLRKKPDVNDCSLVFKLYCGDHTFLFTGDISKQVEAYLVTKYGSELHSDILLAPHHGSKTSNTQSFIETVRPKYIVFSAGYNNTYKFPNPDVMERYAALEAVILRTDLMGALEFQIKNDTLRLKAYRQGAKLP